MPEHDVASPLQRNDSATPLPQSSNTTPLPGPANTNPLPESSRSVPLPGNATSAANPDDQPTEPLNESICSQGSMTRKRSHEMTEPTLQVKFITESVHLIVDKLVSRKRKEIKLV